MYIYNVLYIDNETIANGRISLDTEVQTHPDVKLNFYHDAQFIYNYN